MKYSYYPGCSLHSTAREYDESTRAVCRALGIELVELPDWNCCGATSAHSLNSQLAVELPARNLRIAEETGLDLVIPCAACFNRMKDVDYATGHSSRIKIFHLLEVIVNLDIEKQLIKPLTNLKAVSYYGCLLVRPLKITEFDDLENPTMLDRLLTDIGAKSMDWSYKTECCGASLSLTRREIVYELVSRLIAGAREAGADAIVTACPLCQANLEMRQYEGFPIFYFTELLGIALGLEEARQWLNRHLIEPSSTPGVELVSC